LGGWLVATKEAKLKLLDLRDEEKGTESSAINCPQNRPFLP